MKALVPAPGERNAPLVRMAAAGVAAVVRLDGADHRNRMAWYVVQLGTVSGEVRGHIVGVFLDGSQVELGRLAVAAGTISESRFAVPQRGPRFAHVYVDLRAEDLALRIEAPPLPAARRSRALLPSVACIVAGTLIAAGAAFAVAVPRAPVVAAPRYAAAGDVVRIAYATRGLGAARYTAAGDDGQSIAHGSLARSHGEIALTVPRTWARRHVAVRVDVEGPLGRAQRAVVFAVVPPIAMLPAPPQARIASFVARREETEGTSSVLASYLVVADAGALEVTDGANTVVGRAAFSRGGTSRVALPAGLDRKTLTVRLDVHRGGSRARTAVALPPSTNVIPGAAVITAAPGAPAADAAPASADDPPEAVVPANDVASGAAPDDPFAIVGSAVAGRPMTIAIRRPMPGMRMRLADDIGNAVSEVAVPNGATRVTLTAPAATQARTYYLTCSYGSGHTQEVVVRSVRVPAH